MSASAKFWAKVDKTGDCWLWTGTLSDRGYGRFYAGRDMYAHRYAYCEVVGPVPKGKELDHICRVPRCVNPDHLRLTSRAENGQNLSPVGLGRSGHRGVLWKRGRWVVRVKVAGVCHEVWSFTDVEEARKTAVALRNQLMTHNTADRAA